MRVNVFGNNIYLERVKSHFLVENIITFENDKFYPEQFDENLPLVVLSAGKINQALKISHKISNNIIHITDLMRDDRQSFGDLLFNENGEKFFQKNTDRVQKIVQQFSDDRSKSLYRKIIEFRSTYDLRNIKDFTDLQHEQYFEEFLPKKIYGDFIDVGVFDGTTSKQFRERYGTENRIVLVEPDVENIEMYKEQLSSIENSELIQVGLSNIEKTVRLISNGSASRIVGEGGNEIQLKPLDNMADMQPGMIKIDIEGEELNAVLGGLETIKSNKPILAIACYHSPQQLIEIPETIMNLNLGYKYYFRHYTESIYESIFYAVPQ